MWPSLKILCILLLSSTTLFGSVGEVVLDQKYVVPDTEEKRTYQDIILDCGKEGESHFTISLPENIPEEGLECIAVIGGLQTGRESLKFVPSHGAQALIAYEYPARLKELHKYDVLLHLYSVRRAAISVAPQIVEMIKYLQKQSWHKKNTKVSVMAYSFGAVFTPVTYVTAQEAGVTLGPGVLAYGGAGAYCLFKANLPGPSWLKEPFARMGAALFKPIDPIIYAPKMKGNFLIINGAFDKQIPNPCAEKLQDLIPPPKTVMTLQTDHMHPKNADLNLRLITVSRNWLNEQS